MSAVHTITLPEELFLEVSEQAKELGSSPQEWVTQVLSERFRLQRQTEEFFRQRVSRASGRSLRELLDQAPDVPPVPGDELSARASAQLRAPIPDS